MTCHRDCRIDNCPDTQMTSHLMSNTNLVEMEACAANFWCSFSISSCSLLVEAFVQSRAWMMRFSYGVVERFLKHSYWTEKPVWKRHRMSSRNYNEWMATMFTCSLLIGRLIPSSGHIKWVSMWTKVRPSMSLKPWRKDSRSVRWDMPIRKCLGRLDSLIVETKQWSGNVESSHAHESKTCVIKQKFWTPSLQRRNILSTLKLWHVVTGRVTFYNWIFGLHWRFYWWLNENFMYENYALVVG